MPAGVRFTKISADGWVAMALAENGDAYAWGYNVEGQCGDGKDIDVPVPTKIKDLPIIKEIAMGSHAAAAIDENGVLYTWGADDGIFGELGDELENKDPDPRKENLPKTYSGLKDVKYIYADTYGMIAIKNNGDVYTWGTNDGFGRAGNGKTGASNDQRTPYLQTMIKNGKQAVGYFDYTLVVTEDGKLYACGHNNVQKLGFGDAVDRAIMTLVPGLTNVKWASALYDATSVLLGDDVHTAGYNASYEFGNNSIKSTGRGQTHLHGKWLRPSL
jgi:alpha-tubulin suppressor-like RCC1 family protein